MFSLQRLNKIDVVMVMLVVLVVDNSVLGGNPRTIHLPHFRHHFHYPHCSIACLINLLLRRQIFGCHIHLDAGNQYGTTSY